MVEADLKGMGLVPLNGHSVQPVIDTATLRPTVLSSLP
jgi:GDPmannose 4,6-dehydratase